MDVARTPKPTSWVMLLGLVKECIADPSLCGTLIIDTMDWAELLCSRYVCDKAQKKSIEEFGYGKGYTYLMEEFGSLLNTLNELVERGVNVVVTAHAKMRKFEQPDELGAYDRWEMKLSAKTAPLVKGVGGHGAVRQHYKTFAVKTERQDQGAGRRAPDVHHPSPVLGCEEPLRPAGRDAVRLCRNRPYHRERKNIRSVTEPNKPFVVNSTEETPDKCKDVSDAPAQAAVSEPAKPDGTVPDIPAGIPQALRDLMQANNVTATDIQTAVSAKGYFPVGMEITDYPAVS